MAREPRYLLNRNGRFFARLVIPKSLRPFLDNRTELRQPLGPDRRTAQSRLHSAVASLQGKIAIAERQLKAARGEPVELGRYPLSTEQLALRNYEERLAQDEKTRNTMLGWADVSVDDLFVAELRAGIAGKLTDAALQELVGPRIERYKLLGNTTVAFGSDEWRAVARAMCVSELEALSRVVERDEGDYSGSPEHPLLLNVPPVVE